MQVTVGRIGRAHGVRGYVMVGVRTDEPELRFAVGSRLDTDPVATGPLTVAATRWHSGELLVRFDGVTDRTAAEGLRGTWLRVESGTLAPPSNPDEFRDTDLIGLSVRTGSGMPVGEVTDVLHYGQDLLAIRRGPAGAAGASGPAGAAGTSGPVGAAGASGPLGTVGASGALGASGAVGAQEILVPFVKAIVTEVDVVAGTVVIDPPPGLLDPDEAV
jgi:16S rRNA processing protein RimM